MPIARLNIRTSALTILAAAVLAACGGGGDSDNNSGSTPAPTPTPAATSVPLFTSVTTPTYVASSPEKIIFDKVNAERMKCGFGAINQSTLLDAAAKNHANYLLTNKEFGHSETQGKPGFTGVDAPARAIAAGYKPVAWVSEGISYTSNQPILDSVLLQLVAPYHSQTMMAEYTEIGIGYVPSPDQYRSQTDAIVFNYGSANLSIGQLPQATGAAGVRTYPCEGVTGVASALYGETPSPINRNMRIAPAGHPIMVFGDHGKKLALISASIIEVPTGRNLPIHRLSTMDNDINAKTLRGSHVGYVLPDVPMLPNTAYSVNISGTNDGQPFTRNFTFSTGSDYIKP